MTDQRIIAVAGATGFVGRYVVRELLSRGLRVRGLVRDRAKARAVLPAEEGLRLIQGTADDGEALAGLCAGASGVVNAIGILRETRGSTFQRQHVETTRNLVEAAQEAGGAGPARFIQISALGVSDDSKAEYIRTKWEAEQIVRRSGLPWTIFRPSIVHGMGSDFLKTAKGWVTGEEQPWFFLPYFTRAVPSDEAFMAASRREIPRIAPVAVEDVAWAVGEALRRSEAAGEIINLAGPEELSWPEMLEEIKGAVPHSLEKLRPLGVPSELAAMKARVMRMLGMGGLLPFDEGMAIMGAMDSVASADKARALLGFNPRPFRATLRRYAAAI
jgi:uncharacterized protein YbjT (DUF2867 family)